MEQPMTESEIAALIHDDTERVFSTMLGIPAVPRTVGDQSGAEELEGGVVALVGFTGLWGGSGSIRCGAKLACSITGKLLMAEYDQVNEDVLDAIGEVANMIIGNFKDDAANRLGPLGVSTPTVIYGKSFRTRNWGGHSWVIVPFDCEGELFEVKICLISSSQAHEVHRPIGLTVGP